MNSTLVTCPDCSHVNPSSAKFCAGCGRSISGSSGTFPPPPPPPPPSFTIGSGTMSQTRTIDLPFDPARVTAGLQNVVQSESGVMTGPNTFNVKIAKFWLTLFMKVQMDGTYTVVATPTGSRLTLSLTCSFNALVPVLIINIVCCLLLGPLFFIGILMDIFTWHYFTNQAPAEILSRMVDRLNTGAAQAQFQPPIQPQAQPQTAPQPVDQPEPQPAATDFSSPRPAADPNVGSDPYEQLKKLASLRDIGAITPEEFEAKKAELLTRI